MEFIEHTSELFYYEYKLIFSDSSNLFIVLFTANLSMVRIKSLQFLFDLFLEVKIEGVFDVLAPNCLWRQQFDLKLI